MMMTPKIKVAIKDNDHRVTKPETTGNKSYQSNKSNNKIDDYYEQQMNNNIKK